jgi:hypothetical protein
MSLRRESHHANEVIANFERIDQMQIFLQSISNVMILNDDFGKQQLIKMDKHIRGVIDETLKMSIFPVECYHASYVMARWRIITSEFA